MGRTNETHVRLAIVTMVTVNVNGETNALLTFMHGSRKAKLIQR